MAWNNSALLWGSESLQVPQGKTVRIQGRLKVHGAQVATVGFIRQCWQSINRKIEKKSKNRKTEIEIEIEIENRGILNSIF